MAIENDSPRARHARLPLRGDDIDTDRIIPARFLKADHVRGAREPPVRGRPPQLEAAGQRAPVRESALCRMRRSCW